MTINYVQTENYIVALEMMNFEALGKSYTAVKVSASHWDEKGRHSYMRIFDEYAPSDAPDAMFSLFEQGLNKFNNLCRFCGLSPVASELDLDLVA